MSVIDARITAGDLMTHHTLAARIDWTVHELSQFLRDHHISGAPVVDEGSRIVGVVSETDIVRSDCEDRGDLWDERPHEVYVHGWESRLASLDLSSFAVEENHPRYVRDIMSPCVFSVDRSATVGEIADLMVKAKVHRLMVTAGGQLAGVVTAMDLVQLVRGATVRAA